MVGMTICLVPLAANDFWWHLKAGQLISTIGLPRTNLFAWTLPAETPFVYGSWLGEWLFYQLYALSGLPLIVFVRNMLGWVVFCGLAIESRRRGASWGTVAFIVLVAGLMMLNNLSVRPQLWAWLPCLIYASVVSRYIIGQMPPPALAMLPLTMLFWVNVHGSFVVGLLLLAAYLVGETLALLLRSSRALRWPQLRLLLLVAVITGLTTLCNPEGIGIYRYVMGVTTNQAVRGLIVEWQPPPPTTLVGFAFYSAAVFLTLMIVLRRNVRISEGLVIGGLGALAFGSGRHVLWFALAAWPILATALAPKHIAKFDTSGKSRASWLLVGVSFLTIMPFQPWWKTALPLPADYRALFVDLPAAPLLASRDTPVAAVEHLHEVPCQGRIFNELGAGSYLAWALYPPAQHFIDPRIELYPLHLWQEYVQISQGHSLEKLLIQEYNISCILLNRRKQPELAAALAQSSSWMQSFPGGSVSPANDFEVWRRADTRGAGGVARPYVSSYASARIWGHRKTAA
jgi:fluoride ion exporter CrcB/FEX